MENEDNLQEFPNSGVGITSKKIYLVKTKSFGRTAVKKVIDLDELESKSIEIDSARDLDKENLAAGLSILAGQGPFTSLRFEKTILQFSTGNSNYVIEIPQSKKLKKKFESISKNKFKKDSKTRDNALKIIRERFADGELSEEEFKNKKDLLKD